MSVAFRVHKMGLDSLPGMGLFPKLGAKPLEKHQKLGNGISGREDGGSRVNLLSLKMLFTRCLLLAVLFVLVVCALCGNRFLGSASNQRSVKQQKGCISSRLYAASLIRCALWRIPCWEQCRGSGEGSL